MAIDNDSTRNSKFFSILPDFETIGGDRSSLSSDGLFTRGSYHITHKTAFNLANKYEDAEKIYRNFIESNEGRIGLQNYGFSGEQRLHNLYKIKKMKAWGDYMLENQEDEQVIANLLMEDNNKVLDRRGVDTDALTDGEYNGLHLFMWNAGAGSTKKAIGDTFKRLSMFRRILKNHPDHQHKDEIEQHIETLKNTACGLLYRTGPKIKPGHYIRDSVSRTLCFNGTYPSEEERRKITAESAESKGAEANLRAKSIENSYKDFERVYNHYVKTSPPVELPRPKPPETVELPQPKPPEPTEPSRTPTSPAEPAEPFKPQIASAPTFEDVSPGPPPQQPIAPGIMTGVTEEPEEVIGLEAPIAPSLVKGDMQ